MITMLTLFPTRIGKALPAAAGHNSEVSMQLQLGNKLHLHGGAETFLAAIVFRVKKVPFGP